MGKKSNRAELLDDLAKEAECMYISDLRHPLYLHTVQDIIRQTLLKEYSIDQWNDVASYLAREDLKFQTKEKAIEYILAIK